MATKHTTDETLDRGNLLEAFLTVLNICEPEHPYCDDPYPLTADDVDYGYKQSSGRYYASCGPRKPYKGYTVGYSVDKQYMNRASTPRHLAVLTHEVTHVTEGSHTEGSIHNKAFWREMMFNAWHVRESWGEIEEQFGPVNKDFFIEEVIHDPNPSMVDRRTETVQERKKENAELMGWHDYQP